MATTLDDVWFDEQNEKDEAEQARIALTKSSISAEDSDEENDEDDDEDEVEDDSEWDDDEDDEERIMRSLDSGNGDLYGY